MLCFRHFAHRKITLPHSGHLKRAALVPVTEIPQETQERSPVVSASLMFGKAGA